jgi:hypothetical protein
MAMFTPLQLPVFKRHHIYTTWPGLRQGPQTGNVSIYGQVRIRITRDHRLRFPSRDHASLSNPPVPLKYLTSRLSQFLIWEGTQLEKVPLREYIGPVENTPPASLKHGTADHVACPCPVITLDTPSQS